MWVRSSCESVPAAPGARVTSIRRGASKLYLFPHHKEAYNCFKRGAAFKSTVDHLAPLGLIERRPGGWFPAKDADAISCVKLLDEKDYIALLSSSATTDGFRLQAAKVRDSALLPAYAEWCNANWSKLITPASMKKTLLALHADPTYGLAIPSGCNPPTHVWIMDILGAIIRAQAKKSQEFGFSSFAKHPNAKSVMIGNMDVGAWTSCFMNQFFTRKSGFNAPPAAIDFTASVLSEYANLAQRCFSSTYGSPQVSIWQKNTGLRIWPIGDLIHYGV